MSSTDRISLSQTPLLVAINILLWALLSLLSFFLSQQESTVLLHRTCSVPAGIMNLATQPWTAITYAFAQVSITHLLLNMAAVWFFGKQIERRHAMPSVAVIYIVCSALCAPVFSAIAPFGSFLIGASCGAMALVAASLVLVPRKKINFFGIWNIPVWCCASAVIAAETILTLSAFSYSHLMHIAGAGFGAAFSIIYRLTEKADTSIAGNIAKKAGISGIASLSDAEKKILFKAKS